MIIDMVRMLVDVDTHCRTHAAPKSLVLDRIGRVDTCASCRTSAFPYPLLYEFIIPIAFVYKLVSSALFSIRRLFYQSIAVAHRMHMINNSQLQNLSAKSAGFQCTQKDAFGFATICRKQG